MIEHVVGAGLDAVDTAVRSSAGARTVEDFRQIAGAVPEQRRCLAFKRGENQLSFFAVFAWLQGFGIHHFNNIRVFPNVHAALHTHSKATPGPFISLKP